MHPQAVGRGAGTNFWTAPASRTRRRFRMANDARERGIVPTKSGVASDLPPPQNDPRWTPSGGSETLHSKMEPTPAQPCLTRRRVVVAAMLLVMVLAVAG